MLIYSRKQRLDRYTSPIVRTFWRAAGRRPALFVAALVLLGVFCSITTERALDDRLLSLAAPTKTSSVVDVSTTNKKHQPPQEHHGGRRVIVVTVWSHYPDLMPLQIASVRAFLSHAQHHPIVEIIAVTNANNYTQRWELDRVAKQLDVHVLPVRDAWKYQNYPSLSHINALNFAMQALLWQGPSNDLLLVPQFPLEDDILLFLDSDMFLMEPVSLVEEMNGAALLSPLQTKENKHTYLWPNLSVFSFGEWALQQQQQHRSTHWMKRWAEQWIRGKRQAQHEEPYRALYKELDFDACFPDCPCDCGGCTKYFMERHPDLMVKNWTNTCSSATVGSNTNVCRFWRQQVLIDLPSPKCTQPQVFGPVYHLGSAGSNWRGCDEVFLHQRRRGLFDQMQKVLPPAIYDRHNILDSRAA